MQPEFGTWVSVPAEKDRTDVQKTMLVDIGEVGHGPEFMSSEIGPQMIRLQTFYDCLRVWVDSLNATKLTLEHCRPCAPCPFLSSSPTMGN